LIAGIETALHRGHGGTSRQWSRHYNTDHASEDGGTISVVSNIARELGNLVVAQTSGGHLLNTYSFVMGQAYMSNY
jgi:hypothetical protein